MILRFLLFVAGCTMVAFGMLCFGAERPVFPLVFFGLAIVIGVLFERGRYWPPAGGPDPEEEATGEVFEDPTTGARVTVLYNRRTGARRYVEHRGRGAS